VVKQSFIQDPTLGQTPIMAKVVPILEANIREHTIMMYQEQMGGMLKMGTEQAGTGSPEAISAITQGAAQEILQNNQRMAEMGTTESLEKQTLELQKQQLELETTKTRIDAAESAADVALDKQKMKFDYEKENSKAALEREKIKLEYLELDVEKKKIAVESSEKLAKISEDDKHKTLDRDDNFLIEILKIIMKETGITVTKLKKNINLTPEQTSRLTETETEKFAEGGFTAKAADPISGNPAAPPIWAEGYQPEQVATTLPVDNTADTSTPELIKESVPVPTVGDWEQLDQDIANTFTSGEQLPPPVEEAALDSEYDALDDPTLLAKTFRDSESSDNYKAEHPGGYIGAYQFGKRRLTDYKKATGEKFDNEVFLEDKELQDKVFDWHVDDIKQYIIKNKLDSFIGEEINGIPITMNGLIGVAHLGGKSGMKQFLKSGGEHNPKDSNGTSLSDYLDRFKEVI